MNDSFLNHKEPEEIFLPLSEEQYAEFYSMEMDHFTEDIEFYKNQCGKHSSILELGCGTGRISRALTSYGCSVLSLDLSFAMLQQAKSHTGERLSCVCMDMTAMAFRKKFDHIIIPYNTLNLLRSPALIAKCLQQTRTLLKPSATLLLQLHIPDLQSKQVDDGKHFQFQIFPLQKESGKLIKETLRHHLPEGKEIHLEERYRLRPMKTPGKPMNFRHTQRLAGFSLEQWLTLFDKNGFQKVSLFSDYNLQPFQMGKDSILLIKASCS